MKTLLKLWTLVFLGVATNCTQDELEITPDQIIEVNFSTDRDKLANNFALSLASALKQATVRKFIKEEVIKKFDGDYNFLYGTHRDKTVSFESSSGRLSDRKFSEILFGTESSLNNGRSNSDGIVDSLASLYPLLQIAIPSLTYASAESWDVDNEIPLIAVIPHSKKGVEFITAYDSDGYIYQLPINEEPKKLVIVISENERLIGIDKNIKGRLNRVCEMESEPFHSNETTDFYGIEEYYETQNQCQIIDDEDPGGGGSSDDTTGGSDCDRDDKTTKDELVKMIVNTHNQFKTINDWFDGGQEFVSTITLARSNGTSMQLNKVVVGNDGDFRDCPWFSCHTIWKNIGVEIITWDESIYGDAILYEWIERDTGNTKTVSSTLTSKFDANNSVTVTVSRTITDEDDELGSSIVEYCDNADGTGTLYNTGIISFYVKQR